MGLLSVEGGREVGGVSRERSRRMRFRERVGFLFHGEIIVTFCAYSLRLSDKGVNACAFVM